MRWFQLAVGAMYEVLLVITAAVGTLAAFENLSVGAILTGLTFGLFLLVAAAGVSLSGYGFSGHLLRAQGVRLPPSMKKGILIFHSVLAALLGLMSLLVVVDSCEFKDDARSWMNRLVPVLFLLALAFLTDLFRNRNRETTDQ